MLSDQWTAESAILDLLKERFGGITSNRQAAVTCRPSAERKDNL